MDSCGKAERSRAWIFFRDLGCVVARLRGAGFFNLFVFEGVPADLERGAALLAGVSAGLVFRLSSDMPIFRFNRNTGLNARKQNVRR